MRRRSPITLLAALCLGLVSAPPASAEVELPVPDGVLPPEIPEDNVLCPRTRAHRGRVDMDLDHASAVDEEAATRQPGGLVQQE